jgi:hypothetical protein
MDGLYNIPLKFKGGVYGLSECEGSQEQCLILKYREGGEILAYEIPDYGYGKYITLYGIPRDALENTLQAFYSEEGNLKKITADINGKEMLLYIHYESAEDAKNEIEKFAAENADAMVEGICQCKETISRLFIEYFDDGEYIDIHVKLGTKDMRAELEKKYPDYEDIADSCGDYGSDIITGDNDKLKVYLLCADEDEMDYLHLAVNTTLTKIKQEAVEKLNRADDFKVICVEYD